jgi:exoribonuclease II
MNVLYEEEGTLKVGAVLADNVTSLQVEAPHGKRSKVKAASVLLRFEAPAIADFLPQAQKVASEIDVDFLWECSAGDEFDYESLARDYFGRAPTPVEAAGVLLTLHGAPMYFYKRGRGRYRAAPEDALRAALASIERKKQQALKKEAYVAKLAAGELPPEFEPLMGMLLYRPDRNAIEWKALEEAAAGAKLTPVRLIERCGGMPSTHDYHLNRFRFEHFPRGTAFEPLEFETPPPDLPLADAAAFSIDDATTTEIDDAFSVVGLESGGMRVGIHIAAPALGVPIDAPVDAAARERLSTVYYPGGKITMLPEEAIECYTLSAGRDCPALSLYIELGPAFEVLATCTRIERVRVVDNLRHDTLEPLFNEATLTGGAIEHPHGRALRRLWEWALTLEQMRRGEVPETAERPDYTFRVENDRVSITRRLRGAPIDKLVSELMIHVNSTWGRQLAEAGTGAIYRVQGAGKVRMSTVPSGHSGLRVEQYVWSSSPLRRYVDLVNQRQIIALTRAEPPPYPRGSEALIAIMREFESAYEVYGDFQRTMERYWCLRWLIQEAVRAVEATVLRENLCRFDDLPLVARVASLPALRPGVRVELEVSDLDLIELSFHCEFKRELAGSPAPATDAALA